MGAIIMKKEGLRMKITEWNNFAHEKPDEAVKAI